MFCKNCGASMREGARFCPECGLTAGSHFPPPAAEYSYETLQSLYPLRAIIPLLIIWLVFTAIGVLAALGSGFWFVGVIFSGIVLFAIVVATWANKGRQKKWGVDRTLWILTPEGYGTGYPPDVAKRIGAIGAAGAVSGQSLGITWTGAGMAVKYFSTVIHGLPIVPWAVFASAEYRPEKREIAMHLPDGQVGILRANPDNYACVEQMVRMYMGGR